MNAEDDLLAWLQNQERILEFGSYEQPGKMRDRMMEIRTRCREAIDTIVRLRTELAKERAK